MTRKGFLRSAGKAWPEVWDVLALASPAASSSKPTPLPGASVLPLSAGLRGEECDVLGRAEMAQRDLAQHNNVVPGKSSLSPHHFGAQTPSPINVAWTSAGEQARGRRFVDQPPRCINAALGKIQPLIGKVQSGARLRPAWTPASYDSGRAAAIFGSRRHLSTAWRHFRHTLVGNSSTGCWTLPMPGLDSAELSRRRLLQHQGVGKLSTGLSRAY